MVKMGMAVDLKRCFGCQTCAIACKIANNMPKDIRYLNVLTEGGDHVDVPSGEFPNCKLSFLPFQCQHCEEAPCVPVCPTGATYQEENGIISVNGDLCIGCGACIEACPYKGVRTMIGESPKYYVDVAVGETGVPKHTEGTVEKCTFCKNLVDKGEPPACMQLCPGRARFWGDLDDPNSEVSKAIKGREYKLLQEEKGTKPKIYYLV